MVVAGSIVRLTHGAQQLSSMLSNVGSPYLTVVATARNDDHGGRLLHRLQLFVTSFAAQSDRHGLDAELVLVEWNPPADKPRLIDALHWPKSAHCLFRVIEVPADLHAGLDHHERLPLFQMIAKNVGIRRAAGRWVLATNVDVLFSDALMRRLARRNFDPRVVYRVDRYDVDDVFVEDEPVTKQLKLASENVIRICRRDRTDDVRTGDVHLLYRREARIVFKVLPDVAILMLVWLRAAIRVSSLGARWATAWFVGRERRAQIVRWLRDPSRARRARGATPPRRDGAPPAGIDLRTARRNIARRRGSTRLHTNACGDFTLMAREAWHDLHGYPELEMFSMHLDSVLLFQAYWAGYRERVLTQPLYHIEHTSGFTPESWIDLEARINAAAIPQLSWDDVMAWTDEMRLKDGPIDFNDESWGFADVVLPERQPASATAAR